MLPIVLSSLYGFGKLHLDWQFEVFLSVFPGKAEKFSSGILRGSFQQSLKQDICRRPGLGCKG